MKAFFLYLLQSYKLELKRLAVYKASFFVAFITLPFWTIIQLLFVETLFRQTGSFIGYDKYEAYLFFGSYRIVQGLSRLIFNKRLFELKYLIRGESNETFDHAILKPIDSQLYSSFGRLDLSGIVHLLVGVGLVIVALHLGSIQFTVINLLFYMYTLLLGLTLWYLSMLFVRCLNFWFEELDSIDAVQREAMALGRNPAKIYQGSWGVLLNLVIPVTLMGSVPTDILLGKKSSFTLVVYTAVIALLLYAVRKLWIYSLRKYSSFSS